MKLFNFLAAILLSSTASLAWSCGECEYEDDLGICWTKGGCIIKQLNPIPQIGKAVTLAVAIVQGDGDKIKATLGDVLINSPGCIGCLALAHNVLPNLTDDQIKSVVGQGFLTFMVTGDPILVTIDVATNIATQQGIKPKKPELPLATQPIATPRNPKVYTLLGICMIQKAGDPNIYAAWRGPAAFIDPAGVSHIHPDVDLATGDTLIITAPPCPQMDDGNHGQKSIESATLTFDSVSSLAGTPETLKWWVYGPKQ